MPPNRIQFTKAQPKTGANAPLDKLNSVFNSGFSQITNTLNQIDSADQALAKKEFAIHVQGQVDKASANFSGFLIDVEDKFTNTTDFDFNDPSFDDLPETTLEDGRKQLMEISQGIQEPQARQQFLAAGTKQILGLHGRAKALRTQSIVERRKRGILELEDVNLKAAAKMTEIPPDAFGSMIQTDFNRWQGMVDQGAITDTDAFVQHEKYKSRLGEMRFGIDVNRAVGNLDEDAMLEIMGDLIDGKYPGIKPEDYNSRADSAQSKLMTAATKAEAGESAAAKQIQDQTANSLYFSESLDRDTLEAAVDAGLIFEFSKVTKLGSIIENQQKNEKVDNKEAVENMIGEFSVEYTEALRGLDFKDARARIQGLDEELEDALSSSPLDYKAYSTIWKHREGLLNRLESQAEAQRKEAKSDAKEAERKLDAAHKDNLNDLKAQMKAHYLGIFGNSILLDPDAEGAKKLTLGNKLLRNRMLAGETDMETAYSEILAQLDTNLFQNVTAEDRAAIARGDKVSEPIQNKENVIFARIKKLKKTARKTVTQFDDAEYRTLLDYVDREKKKMREIVRSQTLTEQKKKAGVERRQLEEEEPGFFGDFFGTQSPKEKADFEKRKKANQGVVDIFQDQTSTPEEKLENLRTLLGNQ